MKKLSKFITAGLLATMTALAMAKSAKLNDHVMLYAQPDSSAKVINKLSPTTELIPIYEKEQWLKVGDPRDGQVGWINKKQYSEAMHAALEPHVQTFVIREHEQTGRAPEIVAYQNGKKLSPQQLEKYSHNVVIETTREPGKPSKIVAYENGKKLDEQESQALLERMNQQQREMEAHFMQMQQQFQQSFDHDMQAFDHMSAPQVITLEPGPVVQQPAKQPAAPQQKPLLPNPMKPAE